MHLYVIARGIRTRLQEWENDVLAQYLPYKYDANKPKGEVQLSLRPIQLYEVVFPEEHYDKVLSALQPYDERAGALARVLRKILRLAPVKKGIPASQFKRRHPWVSIIGVGAKKDKRDKDGIELL